MFTGPEHDRTLIRELLDSYSDAVMTRDAAAWGATWAEDGVWRLRGQEIIGRTAIVSAWVAAMDGFRAVVFLSFPGSIQVAGDRASVRTHTFEHLEPLDGPSRFQSGVYNDTVVKVNGRWLFADRSFNARTMQI
ncbi:MAG: nuclear transport factor 2 family protein [Rhodospirillaceae bacterium]|nr:MAG: nuclear transport factor 2 family protein [Rhodospirillaceae bacterium]